MSTAGDRGPQVEASEELYRAITSPEWWVSSDDALRVSSLAFKVTSPFSVNMASRMTLEEAVDHTRQVLHSNDGGIVQFNCGQARQFNFDAREELDPNHPNNKAHANVYYDGSNSQRKRDAKRLAEICVIVHEPSFPN